MNKKQYHVSKSAEGGWKVTKQSNILSIHHTQEEAVNYAKAIAQATGGEVVIHGRNGKIRDKNSYGHDPFPPLG